MPKIPRVGEKQRINPGSPVAVASPQSKRVVGQAISQFGQGVAALGRSFKEIKEKEDELSKANTRARKLQEGRQAAITIMSEVMQNSNPKNADADFSAAYDKATANILASVQDPAHKFVAETSLLQAKNESRAKLVDLATKKLIIQADQNTQDTMNVYAADSRTNPQNTIGNINEARKVLETHFSTGFGRKEAAAEKTTVELKKIAKAGIFGLADNGQDNAAKALLKQFPKLFTGEERNQIIDRIDTKAETLRARAESAEKRLEQQEIRREKKAHKQNLQQILSNVSKITTPREGEAVLTQASTARDRNEISATGFNEIKKRLVDDARVDDEDFVLGINESLANGADPERLIKVVADSKGKITSRTAARLFDKLRVLANKSETDPAFKEKMRRAEKIIRVRIAGDTEAVIDKDDKPQFQMAYELLLAEVARGVDPIVAADTATNEAISSVRSLPFVPGYPPRLQFTKDGLGQIKERVDKLYREGKIKRREYEEALAAIAARARAIRMDYERGFEPKPSTMLREELEQERGTKKRRAR